MQRLSITTGTILWIVLTFVIQELSQAASPINLLTDEEALSGWIAVFDGATAFGFQNAKVNTVEGKPMLQGGQTTTEFADYDVRIKALKEGEINLSGERMTVQTGEHVLTSRGTRGPIILSPEILVEFLFLKPHDLKPLFNGRDLNGWDRRGRVPSASKPGARWSVENGVIRAVGGPEALEYAPADGTNLFRDFIVQMLVRTRRAGVNGGFFFRNEPGKTMMGYEAQLHNTWYDPASGKHGYTTGGIDDRQQARAAIAVDEVPFRMTVVADGPHIATWVNGYQTADWIDTRTPDPNPRRGLRLESGTIQLQAHDPETDIEFHGIWLRELPAKSGSRDNQ